MRVPNWRCRGVVVLRDVAPGKVPLGVTNEDGSPWRVLDIDGRLVEALEGEARRTGTPFQRQMMRVFLLIVEKAERQRWRAEG
jgi:hypothetical protein